VNYDAIVVGAGPGGSTAVRELARRGRKVVLLEQKALPRYKPCGGCLSLKIDRILDLQFRPLVERTVRLITRAGGLGTVSALRRCCSVENPHAPCLPQVAGTGAGGSR